MLPVGPAPPRVSRETRLLLIIALVSLSALWLLARLRFPEHALSPGPLPSVLTQLAPRVLLDDIPAAIGELSPRLVSTLVAVPLDELSPARRTTAALRLREQFAVTLLAEPVGPGSDGAFVSRDPASGLTVLRVPPRSVPEVAVWSPRRPEAPRILLAGESVDGVLSLRPVYVGSLAAAPSPLWSTVVWLAPGLAPLAAGTYLFTTDGALAGLTVPRGAGLAVVPADTVIRLAHRLIDDPPDRPGELGVRIQPLTPAIAVASGAPKGVVVTWVDPRGPSAGLVRPTDVIEAVGGTPVPTLEHWQARAARVADGESLELSVRRDGALRTVTVTASAPAAPADLPHGLTLRTRRGIGVEVLEVQAGSAFARAGVQPGDVITLFAGIEAPSAADLFQAYAAPPADRPLLTAVTRGASSLVLTVSRR